MLWHDDKTVEISTVSHSFLQHTSTNPQLRRYETLPHSDKQFTSGFPRGVFQY